MPTKQDYTSWEYAKAQESWALAESAYELLQAELQLADEDHQILVDHLNAELQAAQERELALRELVEAARDPFLVILESHPAVEQPANAEMARAAKRFREALAAQRTEEPRA